jgi:hypothetical protein
MIYRGGRLYRRDPSVQIPFPRRQRPIGLEIDGIVSRMIDRIIEHTPQPSTELVISRIMADELTEPPEDGETIGQAIPTITMQDLVNIRREFISQFTDEDTFDTEDESEVEEFNRYLQILEITLTDIQNQLGLQQGQIRPREDDEDQGRNVRPRGGNLITPPRTPPSGFSTPPPPRTPPRTPQQTPQAPQISPQNNPAQPQPFMGQDGFIVVPAPAPPLPQPFPPLPQNFPPQPPQGGKLNAKELELLLKSPYDTEIVDVKTDGDRFIIDKELSNETTKVFKKDGTDEVFVVHSGSKDMRDVLENFNYIKSGFYSSAKLNQAKATQKAAEEKYGAKNISTLGHSKGGKYAEMLGKKTKEIITLNKPVHLTDIFSKVPKKQTDIKTTYDPVSFLRKLQRGNKPVIIQSESSNLLEEHKGKVLQRKPKKIYGRGNTIVRPAELSGVVAPLPQEETEEETDEEVEATQIPVAERIPRQAEEVITREQVDRANSKINTIAEMLSLSYMDLMNYTEAKMGFEPYLQRYLTLQGQFNTFLVNSYLDRAENQRNLLNYIYGKTDDDIANDMDRIYRNKKRELRRVREEGIATHMLSKAQFKNLLGTTILNSLIRRPVEAEIAEIPPPIAQIDGSGIFSNDF